MAGLKTLVKSDVGVRLMRVEEVNADKKVRGTHYRLSTLRPVRPRVLADLEVAERAFVAEVAASRLDKTAVRLVGAGH